MPDCNSKLDAEENVKPSPDPMLVQVPIMIPLVGEH